MNFITEHINDILVVLTIIIFAIIIFFVAKGKYRKIAQQILLSLVVAAESEFGDKTGKLKFAYVAEKFYSQMPSIIQILFSVKDVEQMIEDAVKTMKAIINNMLNALGGSDNE